MTPLSDSLPSTGSVSGLKVATYSGDPASVTLTLAIPQSLDPVMSASVKVEASDMTCGENVLALTSPIPTR